MERFCMPAPAIGGGIGKPEAPEKRITCSIVPDSIADHVEKNVAIGRKDHDAIYRAPGL